jgi:hypothetical protein
MMSQATSTPAAEATTDEPGVLQGLLDAAVSLFHLGPVLEQSGHLPDYDLQPVAATTTECVRYTLLDKFGRDVTGEMIELIVAAWGLDPNPQPGLVEAWQRTFPSLTGDLRRRNLALALPYVAIWMDDQLAHRPDLKSDQNWRYEHRGDLAWLRKNPSPVQGK